MSRARAFFSVCLICTACVPPVYGAVHAQPIAELRPLAVIRLGTTADWVAVAPGSVWVGSTGPNAVHRIDPRTNQRVATVELPGEPCAGLALGFGSLWVPLCGKSATLAKVDSTSNVLRAVFATGPVAAEAGIATGSGSVWLVTNSGSLARIDPETGDVRQSISVPEGSYNPHYDKGIVWVTRAAGREITAVDAVSGALLGTTATGPGPRFLTSGRGAIWTLNQGDGTLTRIEFASRAATQTIELGTPGHGGDIAYGAGLIWTTMPKVPLSAVDARTNTLLCQWVGPGGDSLGIGHEAIWLTDYHGGTVSRLGLRDAVEHCRSASRAAGPG